MIRKIMVILLLLLAIAAQMTAGYMDMRDIPYIGPGISKEHLWNDATFLLLMAVFAHTFQIK